MWRPPSALAVALALAACAPRPVAIERTATPAIIVVPTVLPNGRVEITLRPRYPLGELTRIEVAIVATRGTITGPLEARVVASGINEGGAPPRSWSAASTRNPRQPPRTAARRHP